MHKGYREVVSSDAPELFKLWRDTFFFYGLFGTVGMIPNILLFFVLIAYRSYRRDFKLPLLLCISDTTNCLAILVLGVHNVSLYNKAIQEKLVPEETSLSCALSAPVYLRIIGSVMSPLVHAAIAFDRFVCVKYPMWYRLNIATRPHLLPGFVVMAVLLFLPVGFYLAYLRRFYSVKFYCGRRASFGKLYTIGLYCFLVFGYFLAFLANIWSFILIKKTESRRRGNVMRSLKIAMVVSFISFLLISVPNASSFLNIISSISPITLQVTTYLSIVAYSVTLFLYITLNPEFRRRLLQSITCGFTKVSTIDSQLHIDVCGRKTTTLRANAQSTLGKLDFH